MGSHIFRTRFLTGFIAFVLALTITGSAMAQRGRPMPMRRPPPAPMPTMHVMAPPAHPMQMRATMPSSPARMNMSNFGPTTRMRGQFNTFPPAPVTPVAANPTPSTIFNPNMLFSNFPFSFNETLSVSGSIPAPLVFARLASSLAMARFASIAQLMALAQFQNGTLGLNPFLNTSGRNYGGGMMGGGYGGGGSPAYAYATANPSSGNPYDMYGQTAAASPSTTSYGSTAADANTGGSYSTESSGQNSVLTAMGLPNRHGHLDWPLALVALPGEQSRRLRQQVEAAVTVLANSKPGKNSPLVEETKSVLERLQSLTESNRLSMTPGTFRDAEEFLAQVDHALRLMDRY